MVEVPDQQRVEEDKEALQKGENDRHHVQNLCALSTLGRNGYWDKARGDYINELVMSWQATKSVQGCITVKGEKDPENAHFQEHWYPEKSWAVDEPHNIYNNFDHEHQDPKEDQRGSGQGEHLPQALAPPVVVLEQGGDHAETGQGHYTEDVHLEGEANAGGVLLGDQPLESEEQDHLDYQLSEVLEHYL